MDNKVVSINRNGEVLPPEGIVSDKLIETLESLLDRARSGEIIGFAGAVLQKDRTGTYWISGYTGGFSMLGALDCVRHRLVRIAMEE